jgi:peptidoglycan/xylan/chitin deacetylase (PgdA/CDA1 family)
VWDRLVVLLWHNIEGTWCFPSPPGAGGRGLARQLHRLQQLATVVPLEPALEALSAGQPLPPRPVALTFDDGYRDNLEVAVPLLEDLGFPATFFLVPGLLSHDVRPWWEVLGWGFARARPAVVHWDGRALPTRGRQGRRAFRWLAERLKVLDLATREERVDELLGLLQPEGQGADDRLFLDWAGARELVRRGFSVGSHSIRHAILSREHPQEQARDLAASRTQLEAELGVRVPLLAYPNGTRMDYDERTMRAAALAGHTHALGAHAGINRPSTPAYAHPRLVVAADRPFPDMLFRRIALRLPSRWRAVG